MDFFNQILKFPLRRRRHIASVVKSLLRIKGEASAIKLAHQVLLNYAELDVDGKRGFFRFLLHELGPDDGELTAAIQRYQADPVAKSYLNTGSQILISQR